MIKKQKKEKYSKDHLEKADQLRRKEKEKKKRRRADSVEVDSFEGNILK